MNPRTFQTFDTDGHARTWPRATAGVTRAGADEMMETMESTKHERPTDTAPGGKTLKMLPAPAAVALLVTLLVAIGAMAVLEGSGPILVTTILSLLVLAFLARQVTLEVARVRQARETAEQRMAQFEQLMQSRTRELSELSTHLQQFAEKEKSELARHLHDELGGLLTAAKMDLSWLQSRITEQPYGERLGQLGSVLDEAMSLKRRVVEQLRPSLLDHFGLPTALRAHVENVCAKAGLQCEVTLTDEAESIPRECAIALFRVIQEGLANIVRHANARTVRLALTADANRYLMLLIDDGCGMKLNDSRFRWSHGLAGMRHRVGALGGKFAIESSPAEGTTLRIEVPRECCLVEPERREA